MTAEAASISEIYILDSKRQKIKDQHDSISGTIPWYLRNDLGVTAFLDLVMEESKREKWLRNSFPALYKLIALTKLRNFIKDTGGQEVVQSQIGALQLTYFAIEGFKNPAYVNRTPVFVEAQQIATQLFFGN